MKKFRFLAVLLFAACAHSQPTAVPPADVLYRQAVEEAKPGKFLWWDTDNCDDAIPLFQQVIDHYPFSQYATLSQLGVADCYFRQEQWTDAIFHYREFEKLHPTHPEIWKVRYRLAESYHEQSLDYDLDTSDLEQAYYYYSKTAEGDSEFRQAAIGKAQAEAKQLAQRIFYIGRFYERNGEVLSAIDRYAELIRAFPDQPSARDAYKRAADLFRKIDEPEKIAALPKPAGVK
jgi:outer membrane protein assembly factor BamD